MRFLVLTEEIRKDIGELPVLVRFNTKIEIALGIHHLHSADNDRLDVEYNTLMHALNKTSIFNPLVIY